MVAGFRRHKPALSIDSALQSLGKSASRTQSRPSGKGPQPVKTTGFQKLRGSIHYPPLTGIPPEVHRQRYEQIEEETSGSESSLNELPPLPFIPPSTEINESGPLLEREYPGGAKLSLSLDRAIHYRATPAAASAWTYYDYQPTTTQEPVGGHSFDSYASSSYNDPATTPRNPFSDTAEVASVPRLLLLFSLDVKPNLRDEALGIRENFEFISLSFDFWTSSTAEDLRTSYTRTPFGRRKSIGSCDMPLVRGFSASDLATTGFLQSFGQTLYAGLDKAGEDTLPVVLGEEDEHYIYKSFERRLNRLQRPTIRGPDRIAARGSEDTTSAVPTTPITPSVQSPWNPNGHPTPLTPSFEVPAFGTSSIRVMIKRDLQNETAWASHKIPFLIMLEYPPSCSGGIEAKIKLDASTIRKNLPGVARRNSSKVETWMAGVNASKRPSMVRSPAATYESAKKCAKHLADPDEDEQLVKVFPRKDALSVVSCGAGTVKDTLYPSAVSTTAQANAAMAAAGAKTPSPPKPPLPPKDFSILKFPKRSPVVKQKKKHAYSKSAIITPGQYKRSISDASTATYSSDSSSCYSDHQQSTTSGYESSAQVHTPPDDNIDELFDMVLTNWVSAKMTQPDSSPDDPLPGSLGSKDGKPTTPLKFRARPA